MRVELTVNGSRWSGDVEPRMTLADLMRDVIGLTGTHLGCEQGVCGACTVLLDGRPARSCLILAPQADRSEVVTVEAFGSPEGLSDLQHAFVAHGAFQCGFCTPGFLITAEWILRSGERRSREDLRHLLSGNVCRCTGYGPIVDAIDEVASARSGARPHA